MSIDYTELKKIAESATQGHWSVPHLCKDSHTCNCAYIFAGDYLGGIAEVYVDNGKMVSDGGNDCPPLEMAKSNGRFMSAARPEVVLELLADIERLQGDTSSMRGSLKQYSINMKKSIKASGRIQRENDKLKSEIARSTEREILQLAEIEGLRKDRDTAIKALGISLDEWSKLSARNSGPRPNTGHGHVYPRADGMLAKCGGPAICKECATDLKHKERKA